MMFSRRAEGLAVLLVHPGGPFFRNKDLGFWTIPKGLPERGETLEAAARREFVEEVGIAPAEQCYSLGSVTQKAGKEVHAWAFEGELPADFVLCAQTFPLEWPPRSGRMQIFPEVDQAKMFLLEEARQKINAAQSAFLDRVEALILAEFKSPKP
ncbi:MAG: NUDIX domain-containing protein [Deltaproteobacteria bacterium]|nr:NUDIX domain-containing protein [Deltaproteobacteria bacterium]